MSESSGLKEIWVQHRTSQDKYTYFLLAVTASAIAFSVQKTGTATLSWTLVPVALAVLSWGGSFYAGCKNLIWAHTAVMANYNLLQVRDGIHPNQPQTTIELEAAVSGIKQAIKENAKAAQAYAISQFRLAIVGALLFLMWHVIEIVERTIAA